MDREPKRDNKPQPYKPRTPEAEGPCTSLLITKVPM